MRIQHNIAAMNAYRNYNTNTSAVAKNLEKLSSGYKINRAGDDAAGLAISEKMRAQISGLNAAQKNVKDGISLVKTAEGAMQEVQDMLNRMVTLATQSANGTYDNEVDRANLQKEVDQLNEEINRIADSANFNGIKLMDGSLEGDTVSYTTRTGSNKDLLILGSGGTSVGTTTSGIGVSTFVHQDAQAPSLTKFTLDLEGIQFACSQGGQADSKITVNLSGASAGTAASAAFAVTIGGAGDVNGADIAKLIYENFKDSKYQTSIGGVTFNVTHDGSKLTFEMDADSAATIASAVTFTGNFSVTIGGGANISHKTGSSLIHGTVDIQEGKVASSTKYASTVITGKLAANGTAAASADGDPLTMKWFTDGRGIKLGDETYVFALTEETKNAKYGEGFKVIDLTDLADPDAVPPALKATAIGGDEKQTLSEVAARITQAAKGNEMWEVGATTSADGTAATSRIEIAIREKATYSGDADLTTINQIQKQVQFFEKVTVDENVTKGKGSPLTLQIGDTSESFNQLKVSIGDIHTSALGVDKLNIGTQAGAQTAIDTIKDAINQISGIRGTLGATQNRLEHTQNNLSVMAENIQDAESSIRDTDIAEEMMAYTKNNILVQSAQAMLAQANQLPQGVLQLLG